MRLMYKQPAVEWEETLPIGNGRIGALIHGDITREIIGFNDDQLWSGSLEEDRNNYDAKQQLAKLRTLVEQEQYAKADALAESSMFGNNASAYFQFGNLIVETEQTADVTDYERSLSLDDAIARVVYRKEGVRYHKTMFASHKDDVIAMRFRQSEPGNFLLSFESLIDTSYVIDLTEGHGALKVNGLCQPKEEHGKEFHGITFGGIYRIHELNEGAVVTEKEVDGKRLLEIQKATNVVILFTSWTGAAREEIPAFALDYETLRRRHEEDYHALYHRTELYLGEDNDLPTDVRLMNLRNGAKDPALYALYFQYGRYLLISSSREGGMAANLQGLWSWQLWSPWGANYTTNINVEMNYWLAHSCNLEECMPPFFELLQRMNESGKKTAESFGMKGSACAHNSDCFGTSNPVGEGQGKPSYPGSARWAMWLMGGVWMCQELYRTYEYTDDVDFLRETAYPILKDQATFLVDWLYEYKGYYVTCPSTSPENVFVAEGADNGAAISMASTMDLTLIRELFGNFKKTCEILKIEDELLELIAEREAKLFPFQIGQYGQLQEWYKDFDEIEIGHRHVSHLYGLFPGELFCGDERLTKAAKTSLERRLAHGGGYTGWSCAWIINLFAILGQGEEAYHYLEVLLKRSTYPNLWDMHPPFQIDGNFGGAAGIANMLVQDRGGEVVYLPALPKEWKDGYVKGLKIKHGRTVDITWKDGKMTECRVY